MSCLYMDIRTAGRQAVKEYSTRDIKSANYVFRDQGVCLGALAKLRKATVSYVMSAQHGTTPRLPLDGFS